MTTVHVTLALTSHTGHGSCCRGQKSAFCCSCLRHFTQTLYSGLRHFTELPLRSYKISTTIITNLPAEAAIFVSFLFRWERFAKCYDFEQEVEYPGKGVYGWDRIQRHICVSARPVGALPRFTPDTETLPSTAPSATTSVPTAAAHRTPLTAGKGLLCGRKGDNSTADLHPRIPQTVLWLSGFSIKRTA